MDLTPHIKIFDVVVQVCHCRMRNVIGTEDLYSFLDAIRAVYVLD